MVHISFVKDVWCGLDHLPSERTDLTNAVFVFCP